MASILDKAGTNVGNAYKLISANPLDVRFVVADIEERDSIITANGCYPGLEVWVESEKKKYIAKYDGVTYTWEELATVGSLDGYATEEWVTSNHAKINEGIFYVEGTGTTAGTWLGNNDRITEYYDGLTILYKINVAGASTTTLNINGLGAKTVYRYSSTKVTTHYGVNSIIVLSYMADLNSGCWMVLNSYDSTDVNNLRPGYSRFYTADALYDYKICGVDKDGRLRPLTITEGTSTSKTVNTAALRPTEFYYYATTSNVSAGSIVAANYIYSTYSHTTFNYTFNSSGTTYREIYLKGTLDSATGLFTLDTTSATSWYVLVPYNTTITLSDYFTSGSYYILLGRTYSSANYFTLFPIKTLFKFDGTNLREISVDSDTLDGKDSSYYLNYNNLTNKPTIPTIPSINITDTDTKPIIGDITADGHTITVSRIGLYDLGLASAYKYKGSVAAYANLPTTGNVTGDVWNVQTDGMNYAWTGSAWDALGGTVDLSGYTEGADGSTDNAIVRFDGTSGKKIQNSTVVIDDSGNTTLPVNATLKLNTYGTRFLTLSGNNISADMSNETGGWAGAFASVKDPSGTTTTMLGWYGGSTLTHIYMGGAYNDPYMKMTAAGLFTFKNQVTINAAQGTAPLAVTSTTVNTNLNADLLDGKHASDFQPAGNYLTSESDTLQTVTNRGNTTTNVIKIQNGAAAGCLILGGNSGSTGISANTRKLARIVIPDYTDISKTVAIFSADATTATAHSIEFGSRQGDSTSFAPNLMSFSVGAAARATDRYNVAQYQYNKIQFFNHESGGTDIKKTPSTSLVGMWEFNNGNTFVNNTYTYTLPNKTGTIALTSDLPTVPDVSDFVTKSTNQTITGIKTFSHSTFGAIVLKRNGSTNASSIIFQNNNGTLGSIGMTSTANSGLKRWSADTTSVYTIWDSGNDGSGSGLDADLLDGKHASEFQLAGNYLTSESDTLQTVTNRGNTTTNVVKIQNGSAAGAFVLGADVNAITLTANQRKLGRMGVPSYDSTTKTMAGISFDSQANVNLADFGGHPNNTSSIAPDVIRFTVANTHNNNVAGARTLALQISKQDGLVDAAGGGTSVAAAKFFIPVQTTSGIANTGSISSTGGFTHSGLTEASGKTKDDYVLLAGGGTKLVSEITGTTYGADRGISLASGKFGHSNTAITAQTTKGLYKISYDAYGHITGTESFTLPTKNSWNYDDTYVKYSAAQSLTDAQKTQARTNIGAGTSSFSGNYNDLTNKPTIGNGTLTLQRGSATVATFTANQTTDTTLVLDNIDDYYWANVHISTSSSKTTEPTFGNVTIAEKVTMEYDSSYKALKFVFA